MIEKLNNLLPEVEAAPQMQTLNHPKLKKKGEETKLPKLKLPKLKKIGEQITAAPIINDGSLYILTENSRILGFN